MNHGAYLFDLDGVLVDTARLHFAAWRRLAAELGFRLEDAVEERLKGVSREASLAVVLEAGRLEADAARRAELADRKNRWYVESLATLGPADALPGAVEFVKAARAAGIRTAVASASKNAPRILDALGIASLFDAVIDGNVVSRAKPDPEVFLAAAAAVSVEARRAVVFEDSVAGVEAALRGGFRAVGVGEAAALPEAEIVVPGFAAVDPGQVERMLAELDPLAGRRTWVMVERDRAPGAASETRFALANGRFALRGRSPFSRPERPACFFAGAFDSKGSAVTELAALPDPTPVGLFVDDERVDSTASGARLTARHLDLERGLSISTCVFSTTPGTRVEARCERFVSAAEPALWAERWAVRTPDAPRPFLALQAIDGSIRNEDAHPAHAAKHYRVELARGSSGGIGLLARLEETGRRFAFANALVAEGGERIALREQVELVEELYALETGGTREASFWRCGAVLELDADGGAGAALEEAERLVEAAVASGYDALFAAHEAALARRWSTADVGIEGDVDACRSLRFNLFHLLQVAPRGDGSVSIGAKGLHGEGYKGHVFWDTETFMFPFFLHTDPATARALLLYRSRTLAGARRNARSGGHPGARFAWESAGDGVETTPKWGVDYAGRRVRIWTGDEEVHIGADVAFAVFSYCRATGDEAFMRDHGLELVCSIAEFYESLARLEPDGRRHIRSVIGTDEFHEHVDDDAFTNHMVAWTLRLAAGLLERASEEGLAGPVGKLEAWGIGAEPAARWRKAADELLDPFQAAGDGIVEQFGGYFDRPDHPIVEWDRHGMPLWPEGVDLSRLGETRLIKQPDVVQVFALRHEAFERDFMLRNYDFYEARTMHKSSLSPSIHAMVGVRLRDSGRALEYFMKSVKADLADNHGNTGLGLHAASSGGAWQAAVFGFGGFSIHEGADGIPRPSFDPWLPPGWTGLSYKVAWRGATISVRVGNDSVELAADRPVEVLLRGTRGTVDRDGFEAVDAR